MPCLKFHGVCELDCLVATKYREFFECEEYARVRYHRACNSDYTRNLLIPEISGHFETLGHKLPFVKQNILKELMFTYDELDSRHVS